MKRRRHVNSSNVFSEVKKGRLRDKLVESNMPQKLHLDLVQFPNVLYQVFFLKNHLELCVLQCNFIYFYWVITVMPFSRGGAWMYKFLNMKTIAYRIVFYLMIYCRCAEVLHIHVFFSWSFSKSLHQNKEGWIEGIVPLCLNSFSWELLITPRTRWLFLPWFFLFISLTFWQILQW